MDGVFAKMMAADLEEYKDLLRQIQSSEPEYYKKGAAILENKRSFLLKEAQKYVL